MKEVIKALGGEEEIKKRMRKRTKRNAFLYGFVYGAFSTISILWIAILVIESMQ